MRRSRYGLGLVLALAGGMGLAVGCAAGSSRNIVGSTGTGASGAGASGAGASGTGPSGAGASATGPASTGTLSGGGGMGGSPVTDLGVPDGFGACAKFSAAAQQDPAAMLIVLQGSASMTTSGKWTAAGQAIIQAIDNDIFDTMSIGLTSFPNGTTPAPACLHGLYKNVYCSYYTGGTSDPLPVPIAPAGTNKSTAATGVRHDILTWLNSHTPESQDPSNSSPIYDAMNAGYTVLQGTNIAKRMLILITDGGFDCTSVSGDPARLSAAISDGLCPDWESPDEVNALITAARTSATAPVDTFIIGVPGSNTHPNQIQGKWTAAPYWMMLALSTYAVSGSPTTVDPSCDSSAVWTKTGAPPVNPCHIDLSNGANFNAKALSNAIATLRSKELGCTYNLPQPPPGETINMDDVNVVVTANGMQEAIPRRSNPTDMCTTSPCWDYDANGKVVLIGAACSSVSTAADAVVDIYVGCQTVFK